MPDFIVQILLALSAVIWLICIAVYVTIRLHYTLTNDEFVKKTSWGPFLDRGPTGSEYMSPLDRKLHIWSFIGILVFFFPGGYFIGSLLNKYLR